MKSFFPRASFARLVGVPAPERNGHSRDEPMLKRFMIGEWTCLASDADANAPVLFEKFLSGALPKESVALLSDGITGEVFKIEFAGKKYVLKRDRKRKHRFEKLVTSFFAGSNAFRLLRGLHRAASDSPDARGGFAEVYLAADRRKWRFVLESFVLMEFVEGTGVGSLPDGLARYGNACARIIRTLHAYGVIHGDVHPWNFIVSPDGGRVAAIDISGKELRVEERLGVKTEWGGGRFWRRLVRAHLQLRKWKNRAKE